jgi:glycosyltransferase involved in cell wall biosynthesis
MSKNLILQGKKIAHLNAFYKSDCKGGGEKVSFAIRDYYNADLWAGGIGLKGWGKNLINKDSFVDRLWDQKYNFYYLHLDSEFPIWRQIKRQLFFLFSPKIENLKKYDIIIYGGNVGIVPSRIRKPNFIANLIQFLFNLFSQDKVVKKANQKQVLYCHTPPRPFTDQFENRLNKLPFFIRPFFILLMKWVRYQYKQDLLSMDLIISNSINVKNRLKTYFDVQATFIYPPAEIDRFEYIETGDYFLSYARLEPLKRIDLIVDAFSKMPDKKLVICSSGPLKDWLINEIKTKNLTNIVYEGLVSDERLKELVGKCLAGIYIPVNEDIGMTQTELMAAGKPVIGVDEGGLRETVINNQTGILIPENPKVDDFIVAIRQMNFELANKMKLDCIKQAKKFGNEVFFEKLDEEICKLYKSNL